MQPTAQSARRALVVGAGYVGAPLAVRLLDSGWHVVTLNRSAEPVDPRARHVALDLCNAPMAALARLAAEPVDVLFYLVGADRHDEPAYRDAYLTGPRRLCDAGVAPAARWLFASSTAVYGQQDGEWVDEGSPTEPRDFAGRVLCDAEAALHERLGAALTVVRFGGIYGPGRVGLVTALRAGRALVAPGGDGYRNRIHRDDCAGALAHLALRAELAPCLLAVDDEPARLGDTQAWLCARLGIDPATLAPPPAGAPAARVGSKRCNNARLRRTGYALCYPTYREGYAALL